MSQIVENAALDLNKIKGIECKHVNYRSDGQDDVLLIKERVHFPDGSTAPRVRLKYNQNRDFWITKEGFRKYKQKKTFEKLDRLQKFSTTQTHLVKNIGKALGMGSYNGNLRMICRNPYVYGADIPITVLTKNMYKKRFTDCISENTVAVLDIETNVVSEEKEILMVSITYKDRAILAVTKDYLGSTPSVETRFHEKCNEYIKEYIDARKLKIELVIANNPGHACALVMERAHEWMPDFITIFNINFDMPRMIRALEAANYDIADVFSDPSVPQQFRSAKYRDAPPQKVTANGKTTAPHPADLWHWMDCIASFTFVDSMSLYKKLRAAGGQEPSYSLQYLLDKHLNLGKLKPIKALENLEGEKWHRVMQSQYKIEYMVYNIFDCVGVELLDEKVKDISLAIGVLCESSDYAKFPSQPRRLVDAMHFYALEEGYVIATTSDNLKEENDQYVIDVQGHIITLPSYHMEDSGLCILKELPDYCTEMFKDEFDADCTSAYPSTQIMCNMSRGTTRMELSRIQGVSDYDRRLAGINLTGGHNNAMELCGTFFKYPNPRKLLDAYKASKTLH